MASTYSYTTAAKVKSRIKNYQATITDAEIETFITHAEGIIIAITGEKWVSGSIPELVEMAVTDRAAVMLLAYDPSGFTSTSEAALISDVLWASWQEAKKLLSDSRIIDKLKAIK